MSFIVLVGRVNSLPPPPPPKKKKILKGFADNKSYVAEMMISVSEQVENIVGNGENGGYQHFLFTYNVFKRFFFSQGC